MLTKAAPSVVVWCAVSDVKVGTSLESNNPLSKTINQSFVNDRYDKNDTKTGAK